MFLAHSELANPLCARELVALSPIQTVLGSQLNSSLPLFFYLNANGTVGIVYSEMVAPCVWCKHVSIMYTTIPFLYFYTQYSHPTHLGGHCSTRCGGLDGQYSRKLSSVHHRGLPVQGCPKGAHCSTAYAWVSSPRADHHDRITCIQCKQSMAGCVLCLSSVSSKHAWVFHLFECRGVWWVGVNTCHCVFVCSHIPFLCPSVQRVVAVLKAQAPSMAPSSNTGTLLAILLPSILGAALLTAIIVGAVMYWHARRRRQRERALQVAAYKVWMVYDD